MLHLIETGQAFGPKACKVFDEELPELGGDVVILIQFSEELLKHGAGDDAVRGVRVSSRDTLGEAMDVDEFRRVGEEVSCGPGLIGFRVWAADAFSGPFPNVDQGAEFLEGCRRPDRPELAQTPFFNGFSKVLKRGAAERTLQILVGEKGQQCDLFLLSKDKLPGLDSGDAPGLFVRLQFPKDGFDERIGKSGLPSELIMPNQMGFQNVFNVFCAQGPVDGSFAHG
jgi:hypothetical protein